MKEGGMSVSLAKWVLEGREAAVSRALMSGWSG